MTSHLMRFLSLLIICCHSDEFWKTICVCHNCRSSNNKCRDQMTIDHTLPTFIDDFNYARKNIKNILFYYNSFDRATIEMDMRIIAGLTINFSSYSGFVTVKFKYANGDNYGGNYFKFDNDFTPVFIPEEDDKQTNVLKIGSIEAKESTTYFELNGDKKTILNFKSLGISTTALINISKLEKTSIGHTSFLVEKYDLLDITFAKDKPTFKINDTIVNINHNKGDTYGIEGKYIAYKQYNDTLRLTFDADIDPVDAPSIEIGSISFVTILGKMWKPSETKSIISLKRVANLAIPPGDFPSSIYSEFTKVTVTGDTTFHGIIDHASPISGTTKLNITTELKKKLNITFKGTVDADIKIKSPYLNLYIDDYQNNNTYTTVEEFPIGFCFNEEAASYVYIKSAKFKFPQLSATEFTYYCTITESHGDEYLDNNGILKGFVFLDLPPNSVENDHFSVFIDAQSPSAVLGIPGFTGSSNCKNVSIDNSGRTRLKAFKGISAFGTPIYICLKDNGKCDKPDGFSAYPFIDIDGIDDGNLSPYIKEGFKEIYFATTITNKDIKINFDLLPNLNYTVTIIGSFYSSFSFQNYYQSYFDITASQGKIGILSLQNLKLTKDLTFNSKLLMLRRTLFDASASFSFEDKTIIQTDSYSLDQIKSIKPQIQLNDVLLIHDYAQFESSWSSSPVAYSEKISIDNNLVTMCVTGDGIEKCANNIDTKYINNLQIFSGYKLDFKVVSMTKAMRPLNITIIPKKKTNIYSMSLSGNGWTTKLDSPFIINHGNNKIEISLSNPDQASNLKINGDGSVHFEVKYGTGKKYCFYNEIEDTCKAPRAYGVIELPSSNFSGTVPEIEDFSVQLTFDKDNTAYQIPLNLFNRKKVTLTSLSNAEVEIIDYENVINDPIYSLTVFDAVKTVYSKDTDATLNFGQMEITSKHQVDDKWKSHVKLNVSQLTCSFNDLYKFKNITINDKLNLTGDMPEDGEEYTIDFIQDDEANDLVMKLAGDVHIKMSKGLFKIGKYTFMISHSQNYDAFFTLSAKANITIESEVTKTDEFTKFIIDCKNYEVIFNFIGTFPEAPENEESLIMIKGENKAKIRTSSSLPISVFGFFETQFNLTSTNVKSIHGPVEYYYKSDFSYDETKGRIQFYSDQTERINLIIKNGLNFGYVKAGFGGSKYDIYVLGLMSSNIELTLPKITSTTMNSANLIFVNSIGNKGSSKLVIEDSLPKDYEFVARTYVYTQVTEKIKRQISKLLKWNFKCSNKQKLKPKFQKKCF